MNSMVKVLFLSYISVFALFMAGCSSTPDYLVGPKDTVDENRVVQNQYQNKLIVYRAKNEEDNGNDSVIVSDKTRIVGGVMQGQFLDVNICYSDNDIALQTADNTKQVVKVLPGLDYEQYIKIVSVKDGEITYERVNASIAKEELGDYEYQSFLVNRSHPVCEAKQDVILKELQLGADALFKFGGSELESILASSRLEKLVDQINEMKLKITKIVVVGHTDRIGSTEFNQKLSEERAQTIVSYLKNNGITGEMQSLGLGSAEPVTKNCSKALPRAELIECLQPDRRVNVQLWGDYKEVVQ